MTRYVCCWCRRKQEGVNLSSCEDCPGPLEVENLLYEQQRTARENLRRALQIPLDPQPVKEPSPPPVPRKPKPLTVRKLTDR